MSGNYTKIDTAQVAELISHALPIVEAMEAIKADISNDGTELATAWKADVSDQYQGSSIPKLDENLANFLANYNDFISSLKTISHEYDVEEAEMLDLIDAL